MVKKNTNKVLLVIFAVLVVLFIFFALDLSSGTGLPFGTQGITCGGEFHYFVQCPTGTYCRERPRYSASLPYMGGTCAPDYLKTLDRVERFFFRAYR